MSYQDEKNLRRIADSLEKLVELQTPKTVEISNAPITIASDGYDLANNIAEHVKFSLENADKTAKKAGNAAGEALRKFYTDIERDAEKPKDWRADTTELQREKNKLAVRIAAIEAELKRRDQK